MTEAQKKNVLVVTHSGRIIQFLEHHFDLGNVKLKNADYLKITKSDNYGDERILIEHWQATNSEPTRYNVYGESTVISELLDKGDLYIVRHGLGDHNVKDTIKGKFHRIKDAHVTTEGKSYITDTVGKNLATIEFDEIFVSYLRRTYETAELIMNANEKNDPNKLFHVLPCSHEVTRSKILGREFKFSNDLHNNFTLARENVEKSKGKYNNMKSRQKMCPRCDWSMLVEAELAHNKDACSTDMGQRILGFINKTVLLGRPNIN